MAFLVRELSLEFDVQQYAHLSPGMAANAATRLTNTVPDVPNTPNLTTPHGRPAVPRRSLHGKIPWSLCICALFPLHSRARTLGFCLVEQSREAFFRCMALLNLGGCVMSPRKGNWGAVTLQRPFDF